MQNNEHHTWLGKVFGKPFDEVKNFIGSVFNRHSNAPAVGATQQPSPNVITSPTKGTDTAIAADHNLLTVAIGVTEAIKNFILNPVVDAATSIIPTDIDNKIVNTLRLQLPIILSNAIAFQSLNKDSSQDDIKTVLSKIVNEFGGLPDEKKQKFYTSVGADIYQLLAPLENGQKITWGQSAEAIEKAYQAYVELKNQS